MKYYIPFCVPQSLCLQVTHVWMQQLAKHRGSAIEVGCIIAAGRRGGRGRS